MKFGRLLLIIFLTGVIDVSSDAQQWMPQAEGLLPEGYAIYGFSAVDESTVWAVANLEEATMAPPIPSDHLIKVLKVNGNSGRWTVVDVEESMGRVSWDIQAVDENTAWLTTQDYSSGLGRVLYKTEDGGETWEEVLNHRAGGVFVRLLSGQHIYCQNNKYVAWSEDGGENWVYDTLDAYAEGEFNLLTSGSNMAAAVGDTVWVGTSKGRVCRATGYGEHIELIDIGQGEDSEIYTLAFNDHLNGMLQAWTPDGGAQLFKTTDGGGTWQPAAAQLPDNSDTYNISAIPDRPGTFVLLTDGYSTSFTNAVNSFLTTDFGATLKPLPSMEGTSNAIQMISLEAGWGTAGVISGENASTFYRWDATTLFNRIYVNDDAIGIGDGFSWPNALTNLQEALAVAPEGAEIWVAEGTYPPAASDGSPTATFLIDKNIRMLGGFAGAELSAEERDPEANATILSGDLNGDDVEDNLTMNRGDNVWTVVTAGTNITEETVIDGFIISGGHANGSGANESPGKSGGGLHAMGHPAVSNCRFEQNYAAWRGGGAYFVNTDGLAIENNTFVHNKSVNIGGGLNVESGFLAPLSIRECTFTDNEAVRGGGLNLQNGVCTVEDCTFLFNITPQHGGGMRYDATAGRQSIELKGSYFEGNASSFGGGVFMEARSNNNSFSISDCQFTGNISNNLQPGWGQSGGGALITDWPNTENNSYLMRDCEFQRNTSTGYGGGLSPHINGNGSNLEFRNLTFLENSSDIGSGAMDVFSDFATSYATVLIDSCHFEQNTSDFIGGLAVYAGYEDAPSGEYRVTNSTFIANEGREGGALGLWSNEGATASFLIDNCTLDGNTASERGGGLLINPHSGDHHVTIKHSHIINNQSPDGGAIEAYLVMASAPFPENASCLIENSLIAGNSSSNAAISMELFPTLELVNTTVADNDGGGVELAGQSGLTLQNTILYNPNGAEFTDLFDDATVTSNGGNLIFDSSLDEWLNGTDKPSTDPLFDPDFHLMEGSPAIDAGVAYEGMPELDLAGNQRVQGYGVDIGAYESPFVSGANEALAEHPLYLAPNPASTFLQVTLPVSTSEAYLAQVMDAQGKLVAQEPVRNGKLLHVEGLPNGMYLMKVSVEGTVYTGRFVKQ